MAGGWSGGFEDSQAPRGTLEDAALELMEMGRYADADRVLTALLMDSGAEGHLWMAAGICRLKRGAIASAEAAFRMCAWLTGDAMAKQMCEVLCE
jgi:Flp pilus assembly protein TadD